MNIYHLSVRPLSQNDVEKLTELFILAFNYFHDMNSPLQSEYLQALRTTVGLGFTASLADRSLLCISEYYLKRFLKYKEGDFKSMPEAKYTIAQATAQIVGTAAMSFSALKCPHYYEDFICALSFTLMPWIPGYEDDVQSILSKLGVKDGKYRAYQY